MSYYSMIHYQIECIEYVGDDSLTLQKQVAIPKTKGARFQTATLYVGCLFSKWTFF